MESALNVTAIYHQELIDGLDRGESDEDICRSKADFVCSLGALASYDVISFLCSLLLKQSQKARGKPIFDREQAKAA